MQAGDRIDRYVVEALLGEGGMGQVYRAYDERLRRRVALKVVKKDGAGTEALAEMLREARAAATLQHPHAVAIHDVVEGERSFIVMEYVEGSSLRDVIAGGTASIDDKLAWLTQTADALAAAHARGLVHRDVKPENIMITRERRIVKLLDFGIAKVSTADLIHVAASGSNPAFTDGFIKGTPRYMSPEQASGGVVDERTDVFAWGLVAYELLVGTHPVDIRSKLSQDAATLPRGAERAGEFADEELGQHARAAGVAPEIIDIMLGALALSPAKRTPAMTTIVAQLQPRESVRELEPRVHTPAAFAPTMRRPRRRYWWIAAVVAIGIAAVIVASRGTSSPEELPAPPTLATCQVEATHDMPVKVSSLLATADGALGLGAKSTGELRVLQLGTTPTDVTVHDSALAEHAWLGRFGGEAALFALRGKSLVTSELGHDDRKSFTNHLFGVFHFAEASFFQLASSDRDSAGLVTRTNPDGRISTLVLPLGQGCGLTSATEIAVSRSLDTARRATLALDGRRIVVVQPDDDRRATMIILKRAAAGSEQPCKLTLEARTEIMPLPMGQQVALIDGNPWVVAQTTSHTLTLGDATTHRFTVDTEHLVLGRIVVGVLGDHALVVSWFETSVGKPGRIMVALATPAAGVGPAIAIATDVEAELVDLGVDGDRVFVVAQTPTGSLVKQLRCR